MLEIDFVFQIYGWSNLADNCNYLSSLDQLKVPPISEKLDAIQSLEINETTPTFSIMTYPLSPELIFEIIVFIRNITSSIHYLLRDIFGEPTQEEIKENPKEGVRLRVLTIFNPHKQVANTPNRILTEIELSDEKVQDAILSFIKEE